MGGMCVKAPRRGLANVSRLSQLTPALAEGITEDPLAGLECTGVIAYNKKGEWDVYDGDTFRVYVNVPLEHLNTLTTGEGSIFFKLTVRLYGLDAAEIRTPAGPQAREIFINKLKTNNGTVILKFATAKEKFGRKLATVYTPGNDRESINAQLLREYPTYFKAYNGRGAKPF